MSLTRTQSKPAEADLPAPGPKLHVVTFGCQMNKYDSLLVEGRFRRSGYEVTGDMAQADVVLFNTCSVRDHAEERTYSWLGELKRGKRARPELVIGVIGCMAQRVEEEVFARAGHVDIVCGTRRIHHLPELVAELRERRSQPDRWRSEDMRILATEENVDVAVDRAGEEYTGGPHGYLAVMRGCDLNCTFCVVPKTRGRVRSLPIEELVREAEWMIGQGARVVTLLGQTVNSYGEDFPAPDASERRWRGRQGRPSLADLLYRLQELEGLDRIRLVTLHPSYLTQALCEAIRDNDKVDRFLPLPAQSGSDRILKAMKRGYTTDLYRKRVALLREIVPDIELGSDWIVGFPSESEEDFQLSESFLEEMGFVSNYVFKYDARPDTAAIQRFEDDVSKEVKRERNQRLLRRSEAVARGRLERYVGQTLPVHVDGLSQRHPGLLQGRSRHNLPVSFVGEEALLGRETEVEIQQASPYGMAGVLAPRRPAAGA